MESNTDMLRRAIHEHCVETGISFEEFTDIYGPQIKIPEVFDVFFLYPFCSLCEFGKSLRIKMLIDVLTT